MITILCLLRKLNGERLKKTYFKRLVLELLYIALAISLFASSKENAAIKIKWRREYLVEIHHDYFCASLFFKARFSKQSHRLFFLNVIIPIFLPINLLRKFHALRMKKSSS